MEIDKSVLMVVDVQNGFLTEKTRHVLPIIVRLVDQWRKVNGSAVYSRYFNYPGSAFECLMGWRQLYDSPDTDIADELALHARHSIVVDKRTYSAMTPRFAELANRHNWTDIAICGMDTDLCVLKTALDAFENDLTPWVVTNASASTGGDNSHKSGLTVIGRAIGEHHLITAEQLLLMV